jgi:large conductance mechanosensitive channel
MSVVSGFKQFALRGSLVDMATGITVGAAFGALAKSLVDDIIMPPVGLMLGGVDFSNLFVVIKQGTVAGPYPTLAAANAAGAVTVRYGVFLNLVLTFLVIAFAVYVLVSVVHAARHKLEHEQATASVPPEPTPQEKLLAEIRDLLRAQRGAG